MSVWDISGATTKLAARNTAVQKFPLQFPCEHANAVLDGELDELLEYQHLIQRPKYKYALSRSFGNDIGN